MPRHTWGVGEEETCLHKPCISTLLFMCMQAEDDGGEASQPGWRREFNPPLLAERAAELVAGVVGRSRHIPSTDEQRVSRPWR